MNDLRKKFYSIHYPEVSDANKEGNLNDNKGALLVHVKKIHGLVDRWQVKSDILKVVPGYQKSQHYLDNHVLR